MSKPIKSLPIDYVGYGWPFFASSPTLLSLFCTPQRSSWQIGGVRHLLSGNTTNLTLRDKETPCSNANKSHSCGWFVVFMLLPLHAVQRWVPFTERVLLVILRISFTRRNGWQVHRIPQILNRFRCNLPHEPGWIWLPRGFDYRVSSCIIIVCVTHLMA